MQKTKHCPELARSSKKIEVLIAFGQKQYVIGAASAPRVTASEGTVK